MDEPIAHAAGGQEPGAPAGAQSGSGHHSTARVLARTAALELEDLLDEIRSRAEGAQRSRERLATLLDAVVAIGSDLDLPTMLGRIVDAACTLVDARYGALGVVDESGRHLTGFIPRGVSEDDVAGDLPTGHGLLGLLLSQDHPVRLADASAHPDSLAELPAGHPPVDSFVGAPIRVRDRVFGNLYLTHKTSGPAFTEEDEELIVALAAAAGIAIENAELVQRVRDHRDWAAAVGELTQTLLEGRNERSAVARMVKRARDLGGAELAIYAAVEHDGDALIVQAADGARPAAGGDSLTGLALEKGRWRLILSARTPLLLVSDPSDEHVGELSAELRSAAGLAPWGATAVVPVTVGDEELGVIAMCWPESALREASACMESLPKFAEQMGLALEAVRAQRSRSRTTLLEDRDRIARDMHDHVIQRLFATGLSLQAVSKRADGVVKERLVSAVDALDAAVKDIRHAIFELHHPIPEGGLGPELENIVAGAAVGFGFTPDVSFEALGDIPFELDADVTAVVREALANVQRHARATDARVRVSAADDLVITVQDNGIGIPPGAARSGLVNLRERAAAHGGTFTLTALEEGGTELVWTVPLTR